jgi:tetratricopeptide (TPR) repeat protein
MSPQPRDDEAAPGGRPWLRLAQWTGNEFYDAARESLRYAREEGREREARGDLWRLLRSGPSGLARERAAFLLWALLARGEGRDPDGDPHLREAIVDRPGAEEWPEVLGRAWYELGYFLILMGDAQAAEIPMRRAIESGHPDYVDQAQCNLGIALASEDGREEDAEKLLREAAKRNSFFGSLAQRELDLLLASREESEE